MVQSSSVHQQNVRQESAASSMQRSVHDLDVQMKDIHALHNQQTAHDSDLSHDLRNLQLQSSSILREVKSVRNEFENSGRYTIQNGAFVANSSMAAAGQESFAKIVREQLRSVLPSYVEEIAQNQEQTIQGWVRSELSSLFSSAVEESFSQLSATQGSRKSHLNDQEVMQDELGQLSQAPARSAASEPSSSAILESRSKEKRGFLVSTDSYSKRSIIGNFCMRISRYSDELGNDSNTFQLVIQPASFLLTWGISIVGDVQYDVRGWPLFSPHIQYFATIPFEDRVYQLIKDGEAAEIRSLLRQRKIHPADRMEGSGYSYLHVAVAASKPTLVDLFLTEGSDPGQIDALGHSCIDASLVFAWRSKAFDLKKWECIVRRIRYAAPALEPCEPTWLYLSWFRLKNVELCNTSYQALAQKTLLEELTQLIRVLDLFKHDEAFDGDCNNIICVTSLMRNSDCQACNMFYFQLSYARVRCLLQITSNTALAASHIKADPLKGFFHIYLGILKNLKSSASIHSCYSWLCDVALLYLRHGCDPSFVIETPHFPFCK